MANIDVLVEKEKCVDYITSRVPQTAVLLQLAEECNEVAQQALKIVRIYEGVNPTQVTAAEASDKLHEELADFHAALHCLLGVDYDHIETEELRRLNRWCVRIANHNRL